VVFLERVIFGGSCLQGYPVTRLTIVTTTVIDLKHAQKTAKLIDYKTVTVDEKIRKPDAICSVT